MMVASTPIFSAETFAAERMLSASFLWLSSYLAKSEDEPTQLSTIPTDGITIGWVAVIMVTLLPRTFANANP